MRECKATNRKKTVKPFLKEILDWRFVFFNTTPGVSLHFPYLTLSGAPFACLTAVKSFDFFSEQDASQHHGAVNEARIASEKDRIRQQMLAARLKYSASGIQEASAIICRQLVSGIPRLRKAHIVAAYMAHAGEVVIDDYLEHLLANEVMLLLPRFNKALKKYDMVPVRNLKTQVSEGYYGIREPNPDLDSVNNTCLNSEEICWLVPGIAFDLEGNRIGYGKGFFDQLLHNKRAFKIGIAYDWQVLEKVPVQKSDVPMNMIVTGKRTIS